MKRLARKLGNIERKWKLAGAGALILIILIAPSYYFYNKYRSLEMMLKNPQAARVSSTNEVVKKVGKHIQLPKDESPELMTVSNKERLAGLAFFKNAQNGDKVLLYKSSKMAYLYRPASDQLINAAPIVNPEEQLKADVEGAPPGNVTPTAVRVMVYNGTSIAGFGRKTGDKVESVYPAAEIVGVENAGEQTYKEPIVIDITGTNKAAAEAIAKGIGGTVTNLPPMEEKPEADILVIAGGS